MRPPPLKSENRNKQTTTKTVTAKAEKKDWSAVKQSAILMINTNIQYRDCLVLPTKVSLLLALLYSASKQRLFNSTIAV